jgi:hypothetical protein
MSSPSPDASGRSSSRSWSAPGVAKAAAAVLAGLVCGYVAQLPPALILFDSNASWVTFAVLFTFAVSILAVIVTRFLKGRYAAFFMAGLAAVWVVTIIAAWGTETCCGG